MITLYELAGADGQALQPELLVGPHGSRAQRPRIQHRSDAVRRHSVHRRWDAQDSADDRRPSSSCWRFMESRNLSGRYISQAPFPLRRRRGAGAISVGVELGDRGPASRRDRIRTSGHIRPTGRERRGLFPYVARAQVRSYAGRRAIGSPEPRRRFSQDPAAASPSSSLATLAVRKRALYPDYLALAPFLWARAVSHFPADDPVKDWFERELDLFGGHARRALPS